MREKFRFIFSPFRVGKMTIRNNIHAHLFFAIAKLQPAKFYVRTKISFS